MPIQQNCTRDDADISYVFVYFTVTVPKYVQYCLLQCNTLHILKEHQTQITRENIENKITKGIANSDRKLTLRKSRVSVMG
jgi:hypothetical protein